MSDSPFAELEAALGAITGPGSFCAVGQTQAPSPSLRVAGFGLVPMPIVGPVAELLRAIAEPAPNGGGGETLVDPAVRRCMQIDGARVELPEAGWAAPLASITQAAAAALGVTGAVTARLYKLLIYGPGDHFAPHRDTENEPGMFATLVVAPPGEHDGGEIVVTHRDQERVLRLGTAPTRSSPGRPSMPIAPTRSGRLPRATASCSCSTSYEQRARWRRPTTARPQRASRRACGNGRRRPGRPSCARCSSITIRRPSSADPR